MSIPLQVNALFVRSSMPNLPLQFLKVTVNCLQIQFLLIIFMDIVKNKKTVNQRRKQVKFMPIMKPGDRCRHVLQQELLAMGHCSEKNQWTACSPATHWKAPWDLIQDLMTGMKLTHGIMVFPKHDSSQISCHLAQWGLWKGLRHPVNDFRGISCGS